MFDPGFLKWRYFGLAFVVHAAVVYFMISPVEEVFSEFGKWTVVMFLSYGIMAIPFALAMRIPWITIDGRREFIALIIVGIVRGFAILDIGLLLDLPQVKPYLLRPLNSAIAVPLWFLMIRFIFGARKDFQSLFHELYVRNIRERVASLLPATKKLGEKEIDSIEAQVKQTLEPLKKVIEDISGAELDKETLKRESLIIQSFIEDRLRPLSHELWRQQQIKPPRLNYLTFLWRLTFKTKSQFGLAILPAFIYSIVGLTTITNFDFALQHSLLNLGIQSVIFLAFEFTYQRVQRLRNVLNLVAISLCAFIPAFVDEIFLGSLYSLPVPTFVESIGIGWFLSLTLAFSIAKAQTNYRKEMLSILVGDLERPISTNQQSQSHVAEKYAKYLHGDIQSTLSSSQMQLMQASESGDAELGKSAIEKMASLLRRDHHEYAIGDAISPFARFQQIIDAWDGIATIEVDVEEAEISEASLLKISEVIEELVSNAIRHGQANIIKVEIQSSSSDIAVSFIDNGVVKRGRKGGMGTSLLNDQTFDFKTEQRSNGNQTTFKIPI
jgi:anti-sigma regulatory factor (Ser/Thr protein kinase)